MTAAAFQGEAATRPFVLQSDWFADHPFEGREERDGLAVDFAGWSRPLEAYVRRARRRRASRSPPCASRGPDPGPLPPHLARATRMPVFLWLVAEPHPA